MLSCFRQCRRGLTRESDLLSQKWALTRSKAKHFQALPKHRSRTHRRKRIANQPPNPPPVSNQTGHSRLSFTSQQKQSSEESLLLYQPTHPLGRGAHTNLCYYYIPFSTTHSSAPIYSSYNPYFRSGELQVQGLSPTSSRLSRSSSVLLHKGPFPPPDFTSKQYTTASRLLSQFTSQSAPTVLFLSNCPSAFSIQHSVNKSVLPHWFEDHIRTQTQTLRRSPPQLIYPTTAQLGAQRRSYSLGADNLELAKRSFIG